MRIGIDCRTILNPRFGEHAGIGHYTYYLVTNLLKLDKKNEYVLFFDKLVTREAASRIVGDHPKTTIKFFPFHEYRHHLLPDYSKHLISAFASQEKMDLLHTPSPLLYTGYVGKNVVTLHDLAMFRHPQWFEKKELGDKDIIKEAVKHADKIIAVSEYTKNEAIDIFSIPSEKIKVVYQGVDTTRHFLLTEDVLTEDDVIDLEDLKKKYNIEKNYILYLGTIEPRKNIETLLEAKIPEDFELVIAGLPKGKSKKLLSEIKKKKKVKYLGYVPHQDKFALIKHASCFVNVSLYEGFGLQVLEAMEIGTPIIASNITSLPEVVGKAGLLVNPKKSEEISDALEKILTDENIRETLVKEGVKRAQSFSWEKTAEETLDFYRDLC
ncbi:MAG: glycosyltransferase family 1 protein [Patescibacteria group bacterium]|nr:glycosyltransferase family 1 protein [Patescibacteria group bacterium]